MTVYHDLSTTCGDHSTLLERHVDLSVFPGILVVTLEAWVPLTKDMGECSMQDSPLDLWHMLTDCASCDTNGCYLGWSAQCMKAAAPFHERAHDMPSALQ